MSTARGRTPLSPLALGAALLAAFGPRGGESACEKDVAYDPSDFGWK